MKTLSWCVLVAFLSGVGCSTGAGDPQILADSIDELLANPDDFELCNGVFLAIAEVTGNQIDAASEPEPCRTVTLVWHSSGIIGNGGFQRLFEGDFNGDPGYRITAAAYRRIGANEAYAAFRDALALFPEAEVPATVGERSRIYEAHPEDHRLAIDNRFFASAASKTRSLAQFIRFNKDAIRKFLVRGRYE